MRKFTTQIINEVMIVITELNAVLTTLTIEKKRKKLTPVLLKVKDSTPRFKR